MRLVKRLSPALVVACTNAAIFCAAAPCARAQVSLPPPPPPPLSTNESPSPPPPSSGNEPRGGHHGKTGHGGGGERTTPTSGGTTSTASSGGGSSSDSAPSDAPEKTLSLRANVLPIFEGVLSVDAEYMFAPHHAVIGTPRIALATHRTPEVVAYGFGFADRAGGLGGEVGYHYWIEPRLEGLFLGPSVVFGATFAGPAFLYYGAAFDVGWQMILGSGFTLNFGGGLLVIDGSLGGIVTRVTPRALAGLGWSF